MKRANYNGMGHERLEARGDKARWPEAKGTRFEVKKKKGAVCEWTELVIRNLTVNATEGAQYVLNTP